MIKNFLTIATEDRANSHDGTGPYRLAEIWGKQDFRSNVDFLDRMIVPPGSTVGFHRHGENEEMYIILSGSGEMNLAGPDDAAAEPRRVGPGDMILNPPHGAHGLVNDGTEELDILVLQIGL